MSFGNYYTDKLLTNFTVTAILPSKTHSFSPSYFARLNSLTVPTPCNASSTI